MATDDVDSLAQSLAALKSSLEGTQKSTGDILSILEKVDDRLSSLEHNMGPIRRVTEQLTTAEANVIKTHDCMNKLHENFKVVADAEAMVRKGLAHRSMSPASESQYAAEDEANLAGYIEVVDRVAEAISFLKKNIKMQSSIVTLRTLEGKQQNLLSALKDEIYRLLSAGSQSVINRGHAEFQAADPITTAIARKVKVMCEAMIRSGDNKWTEAYVKARRTKMEIATRNFLLQGKPSETGETAEEQRLEWIKYMQFLRELIKAEDVVLLRALPKVPESVTALIELIQPAVAQLCKGASDALEAIVSRQKSRGDKAVTLLSLVKGLKQELPAVEKLLRPEGTNASQPVEQVRSLYLGLCTLTIASLATFADDVANDSTDKKNLPPTCTVHVVTSNTIRAFKRLMAYHDIFEELAKVGQLPWVSEDDPVDDDEPDLHVFANHVFHCLLRNLRAKAEAYDKMEGVDALSAAGRRHLFLINNANYMNKALRGEESGGKDSPPPGPVGGGAAADGAISTTLSEIFLERVRSVVDEECTKFMAQVWEPLAAHVKDTTLSLDYAKGSSGVLTLDSGRQVKARFTAFNTGIEEVYQHQKGFAAPDPAIRARLRNGAKSIVIGPYTAFFNHFSQVHFSKKHMEEYLRFPPKTVSSMIDEMYSV